MVFPKYNFETEEAITFIVYDGIKPSIQIEPEISLDVGGRLPDFSTFVNYSDNYDAVSSLKLTIFSGLVNMNVTGTYDVTYQVLDLSMNETSVVQRVKVTDRIKPVIKQKTQILLNINQKIEVDKYFSFEDNYDKVLKIQLDDSLVNYLVPGVYDIWIISTDQSGNESRMGTKVTIVDNESPVIKLKVLSLIINYQEALSLDRLKNYIQSVSDNLDDLSIEDIQITSYVESNFIGTYEVIYEVTDSNNLKTSAILSVVVKDIEAPKVVLKSEIVVKVFDLEPYIYDYLLITDNYDRKETLTMSKTGSIDTSKTGLYRVIVTVKDAAKNETIMPVIVQIIDDICPSVHAPLEIQVTDFKRPIYETLITASDNYDKTLKIVVLDEMINYTITGSYEVLISVKDLSLNETKRKFTLNIIDDGLPEVILKTLNVHIGFGVDRIDYLSYVDKVYDQYDKNIALEDIEVISKVDLNVIGLYPVIYRIKDSYGNESESTLLVFIDDYESPVITVSDVTLKKGERFDYLNYASAYDNYDLDISKNIKINPNFIPTTITGHYEVTFYVHDSSGNYSESKVILTVMEDDLWVDYVVYGSGVFLVLGSLLVFYMMKKKREKF